MNLNDKNIVGATVINFTHGQPMVAVAKIGDMSAGVWVAGNIDDNLHNIAGVLLKAMKDADIIGKPGNDLVIETYDFDGLATRAIGYAALSGTLSRSLIKIPPESQVKALEAYEKAVEEDKATVAALQAAQSLQDKDSKPAENELKVREANLTGTFMQKGSGKA